MSSTAKPPVTEPFHIEHKGRTYRVEWREAGHVRFPCAYFAKDSVICGIVTFRVLGGALKSRYFAEGINEGVENAIIAKLLELEKTA